MIAATLVWGATLFFSLLGLTPAFGQEGTGYQTPNSTIGASVGTPWLVGGRGEAWYADELTAEVGAGALGTVGEGLGVDVALRWRPDALCFGCTSRALATIGVGLGGTIEPVLTFDGPWTFAAGPDLAVTGVYWLSPTYGLALSLRGGGGWRWTGTALADGGVGPWGFATLGLAF